MMAPGMIPGETPYTPEEMEQLDDLVSQAADQDPGENMEDLYINRRKIMDDEKFDEYLTELINEGSAADLLTIPGVYEAVAEVYNNDIIKRYEYDQEIARDRGPRMPGGGFGPFRSRLNQRRKLWK